MPSTDDTNPSGQETGDSGGESPFRDAEAWLAEQGIRREPLVVSGPDEQSPDGADQSQDAPKGQERPPAPPPIGSKTPPGAAAAGGDTDGGGRSVEPSPDGPEEASGDAPGSGTDGGGDEPEHPSPDVQPRLEDQVNEATAYARRATANTPISEARLRSKMESRGYPPPVVTQAMQRARQQRIVDDHAYAMALVEEGRGKGHAPLRIKTDMRKRDLSDEAIQAALDTIDDRDPEAQAFAVARKRAERYRDVDTETAYRRLVGYLARRGYTEALSRKVARQAVFNDREPQRTAER